jgi:hypothetical protein
MINFESSNGYIGLQDHNNATRLCEILKKKKDKYNVDYDTGLDIHEYSIESVYDNVKKKFNTIILPKASY